MFLSRLSDRMNSSIVGCLSWSILAIAGFHFPALAQTTQVEEIYIARSVRESRVAPTENCSQAKTGFVSDRFEDQYNFRSTATRSSDGRMLDSDVKTIGSGRGCFGKTSDPAVTNFYLELHLGNTVLKGIGDCRTTKSNFPEAGVNVARCFLNLSDPLGRYVGGQLTTNTIWSLKDLGVESDPAGYAQPSIATIRLWKKRTQR